MTRRLLVMLAVTALTAAVTAPAAATTTRWLDDPLVGRQWALELIGAPLAWRTSTGDGVRIAIVDSGVDLTHEDLRVAGGASFGGCETQPEGCGNGSWVHPGPRTPPADPLLALGWHVGQSLEATGIGEDPALIVTHGTQVAGIAAAVGGNGRGIAGVAPRAEVLAVNVDHGDGFTSGALAAGIRWATRQGAAVINLSLGAFADEVRAAVREAVEAGVVVVAAGGNSIMAPCAEPAALPGVICVVATDRHGLPTFYSARAVSGTLTLAAPGGSNIRLDPRELDPCGAKVLTTTPATLHRPCDQAAGRPAGYGMFTGTSAASPHVAGVAALLAAQCRGAQEIRDVLARTARHPLTGVRGGWDPLLGHGLVDAAAAVAEPIAERRPGCAG